VDRFETLFDFSQPSRIELDAVGVVPQRIRGLAQLRLARFEQRNSLAQRGIVFRKRPKPRKAPDKAPSAALSDSESKSIASRTPSIRLAAWASRPCSDWMVSHSPGCKPSCDSSSTCQLSCSRSALRAAALCW